MSRVLERTQGDLMGWQQPGTWEMLDGQVSISCPLCTRSTGVQPSESGAVAGFQCGADRCGFQGDLQLEGYAPASKSHDVKVADALHMDEGAYQNKPPGGLKVGRK